jgi:hypothetical protein
MAGSANTPSRCFRTSASSLLAVAAVTFCLTACDPNVVIGAKRSIAPGGTDNVGGSAAGGGGIVGNAAGVAAQGGNLASAGASGMAGAAGTLLFEAHHESDLSEWTAAGPAIGGLYADDDDPVVTTERAHSGSGSVKMVIDTGSDSQRVCRLYHQLAPGPAYYGAWYFIEEDHSSFEWWTTMLFKAQTDAADIDTSYNLWDIDQIRTDGYTTYAVYDHPRTENHYSDSAPALPIGRWFHIEAYFAYEAAEPTELQLWLDGISFMHLTDLDPTPADPLFWGLGNGASQLVPSQSTIFIDDVTISTVRVGP